MRPIEDFDTAGVLETIVRNQLRDVAAIASAQAARDYNAQILARDIQDRDENYTRFLLISKAPLEGTLPPTVKCSIIFCIKNQPGSLFKTFGVFGSRDLDIIRIETRPLVGTTTAWRKFTRAGIEGVWDTMFYMDFRGAPDMCQNAIAHLREISLQVDGDPAVKVLGVYPEGEIVDCQDRFVHTKSANAPQ